MSEFQHDRGVGHGAHFFLEANLKIHLQVEQITQQLNADRRPQNSEKVRISPHNWVRFNKRGIKAGSVLQGGNCEGRKVPFSGEISPLTERSDWREEEF